MGQTLICSDCCVGFEREKSTGRTALYCPDCKRERARAKGRADQKRLRERRGPEWSHEINLKRKGLTVAEYDECLAAQGGGCALCGTEDPGGRHRGGPTGNTTHFYVDHDHVTGKFRGLLCNNCNVGIGKLGDDAEGVRRALKYLEG